MDTLLALLAISEGNSSLMWRQCDEDNKLRFRGEAARNIYHFNDIKTYIIDIEITFEAYHPAKLQTDTGSWRVPALTSFGRNDVKTERQPQQTNTILASTDFSNSSVPVLLFQLVSNNIFIFETVQYFLI